jgi:hypothetical protein
MGSSQTRVGSEAPYVFQGSLTTLLYGAARSESVALAASSSAVHKRYGAKT